jgi:hypothetical protein
VRENTCVSPRIAYNAAAGVEQTSHKLFLPPWGFSHLGRQTKRERIPRPLKNAVFSLGQHHLIPARPALLIYAADPFEVPCDVLLFGRCRTLSGSKKLTPIRSMKSNIVNVFRKFF